MNRDFERLAIVNRGEPAMRCLHAARELVAETGRVLRTIALYTEPDRRAMFVRQADEAYSLGSATFVDERDGERKNRYLDYDALERALVASRADAVWVGWGFVAEHAEFADLCERLGIVFVGPSGDVMRRLGDKISSKKMAEEAEVPVAPWSGGGVDTLRGAREQAERLGFPLMVKATAGGGGRGIRKVLDMSGLDQAFESARNEALKAFGDDTVFLERLVEGAHHVEVQVIADHHGNAWGLGVRDCTLQRRHQKVLEETPSPVLDAGQDAELRAAAVRLCRRVGYQNAGTVEFLYDPRRKSFSFMEVNARLQVEHPVTELVTGADLVKLQLHVARGGRLEGDAPPSRGHAVEVRLNAEDPAAGFAPAPGTVELLRLPTGPGVRFDTGVEEGDVIPAEFDSMVAKVMVWGHDRDEALGRLRRALADTAAVVRGGTTNKGFLLRLLGLPEVVSGEVDVGWLDRLVVEGGHVASEHADIALLAAAIDLYDAEAEVDQTRFLASAARGRPEVAGPEGHGVDLEVLGGRYHLDIYRLAPQRYRLEVDGCWVDVDVEPLGRGERRLRVAGRRYRVLSVTDGRHHLVEVDGVPHRVSADAAGVVRAPSPAVVVSIAVQEGDEVAVGDRLVLLEAMKMEMSVTAKLAGRVSKVRVRGNVQVPPGEVLLEIEPTADDEASALGESLSFDDLVGDEPEDAAERCRHNFEELRALLLGFDVGTGHLRGIMRDRGSLCQDLPADDERLLQAEDDLLGIFLDLASLFRGSLYRGSPDQEAEEAADDGRLPVEEYLYVYLRDLESMGENLPASFVDKLRRALAHYGVDDLEHTPELEQALYRVYRSHRRVDEQLTPILSILERRLEAIGVLRGHQDAALRPLLDRLIAESRRRWPAVWDSAREVRYRYFEQPLLDAARAEVYARATAALEGLDRPLEPAERRGRVASLVASPQPMHHFVSRRFAAAGELERGLLLEVLTRRYYRIRDLRDVEAREVDGVTVVTAEYVHPHDGRTLALITTHVPLAAFGDAAAGVVAPVARQLPPERDLVIDVYAWSDEVPDDVDALADELRTRFDAAGLERAPRRLVVTVASGSGDVLSLAFRSGDDGLYEEKVYRGLHPMLAKRLHLWRLSAFDLERLLPSDEDVYLFRAVARDNPADERLVVLAEVRDLTPVRDESGRVVSLPHLERMYQACLAPIRRVQSRRGPRERLFWNRVLLYLWPTLELRPDEINDLVRRLAPESEGLGLEKVVVRARVPDPARGDDATREQELHISDAGGHGMSVRFLEPSDEPVRPLSAYEQRVVRLRRRGLVHPYELLANLAPGPDVASALPPGRFVEHDLDDESRLVPVERPAGQNTANMVVGVIESYTAKVPEGMKRVILVGDPGNAMGSLAEPECRRILAALDLAEEMSVPLEWFAVSAGAKIAMDSGTENMDWIAAVLRRLVTFTQAGGEVNIVVTGINVGAQPYWNAEATMLMHTRGILIMTAQGAMVLTGKQALDYSGGVSAEDNFGIGGYEHIMGPNGQAQYFAEDVGEACEILLRHYDHTYVVPGERFPRRASSDDPRDRDVCRHPHGRLDGTAFTTVGDVFDDATNPGRKKPFDIRQVMAAVVDQDHQHLERWYAMRDAEVAVVWDAHLGGQPLCLLGLESRPLPRLGYVPADGPRQWTSGTLFPLSSKKVARAINAASGNRPVVILANLSGFDGSPESMRSLQLEFGAEIGRAVVNFDGPMVFCVVQRYHGGAFVVFSAALNENLEVAALEGTYASVIGGAPAAAVVFARQVAKRTAQDPEVMDLEARVAEAQGAEKVRLQARLREVRDTVHSRKLGEVADEFDRVHSVQRAQKVGSVHHIIPPQQLRPYLVGAVERGMKKALDRTTEPSPA